MNPNYQRKHLAHLTTVKRNTFRLTAILPLKTAFYVYWDFFIIRRALLMMQKKKDDSNRVFSQS